MKSLFEEIKKLRDCKTFSVKLKDGSILECKHIEAKTYGSEIFLKLTLIDDKGVEVWGSDIVEIKPLESTIEKRPLLVGEGLLIKI